MRKTIRALAVAIAALLSGLPSLRAADEMPVPVELQAALFKKIFDYDRTLQNRGEVVVLVVHPGGDSGLETVLAAFRKAGIVVRSAAPAAVAESLEDVAVVYLSPGVDPTAVAKLCESRSILTISGVPDLAARGEASIAIGVTGQKPQILVNLRRLKVEGHDFESGLLEVATVVR